MRLGALGVASRLILSLGLIHGIAAASGCARLAAELHPPAPVTVLEPYPRHDDSDAVAFNDLPVRLFFFAQAPPAGTSIIKPVKVLFKSVAEGKTCRDAGIGGLQKLQRVAVKAGADAVVNIRSTWEGAHLGDEVRFGCRRVNGLYLLVWEGALAKIPAVAPAEETAATPTPTTEDAMSARLRELQSLYYQGLITREEFLERRQKILDGL